MEKNQLDSKSKFPFLDWKEGDWKFQNFVNLRLMIPKLIGIRNENNQRNTLAVCSIKNIVPLAFRSHRTV